MPKRDPAYMANQSLQIARAAMECLLENGVHDTSLRDICARAGVSMGALYVHYRTKEDVILAACRLDYPQPGEASAATDWNSYAEAFLRIGDTWQDERTERRRRLSLQFVGAMSPDARVNPALMDLCALHRSWFVSSLEAIHRGGEIALPLGLETTADIHVRLLAGTQYMALARMTLDFHVALHEMTASMALIAGRMRDC